MAQVAPALRLCKHQITILATLSSLTISSSINIFYAFRILQTRWMILYSLHCPNFNSKLGALLRGATCLRHLYGTTITAHQQFSRSFFEPCAVYLRFCHVPRLQPLFYIGSTAENTLEREHTRFRKFKQVNDGQFVLSELAIRYWSHCNNFFPLVTSSYLCSKGKTLGFGTCTYPIVATQTEFSVYFPNVYPKKRHHPSPTLFQLQTIWYSHTMEEEKVETHWKEYQRTTGLPSVFEQSSDLVPSSRLGLQYQEAL